MHTSDPTDLQPAAACCRGRCRRPGGAVRLPDSRLIFGLILRVVRERGDAEDILQEAFVWVWTRAETYDAQAGGPLAWIVRVARNCAIDRLRARRVRATGERARDRLRRTRDQPRPIRASRRRRRPYWMAERRRTLTNALAGLPAEQRRLIEAAFFEGVYAQRTRPPFRTAAGDRQRRGSAPA